MNVYNLKEDFYEKIKEGSIPEYDVLVTNPPYSVDHMENLLKYCANTKKPWFLLLPNYVYTKDYYVSSISSNTTPYMFYVTPHKRYLYSTPKGRRQSKSSSYTSPFPTFWYCNMSSLFKLLPKCNTSTSNYLVTTNINRIPLQIAAENDLRKKREKNAMKRKKNKDRKRQKSTS